MGNDQKNFSPPNNSFGLRHLFSELSKNKNSRVGFAEYLANLNRKGVLAIDPPEGFFVEQGCLAISSKSLITGGLGPCVAVTLHQKGRPRHLLAHLDSYGLRGHSMEEVAEVVKQHFDPRSLHMSMAVHNAEPFDELKVTVLRKMNEFMQQLSVNPSQIVQGIPLVTPYHTVHSDLSGNVSATLSRPATTKQAFGHKIRPWSENL